MNTSLKNFSRICYAADSEISITLVMNIHDNASDLLLLLLTDRL
jgi:hypothetical protein